MHTNSVAVVANPMSTLGRLAVDTLKGAGWQVVAMAGDAAEPETWQELDNVIAGIGRPVELVVTALPDEQAREGPSLPIRTAWLGAKHALKLFGAQGEGILLTLARSSTETGTAPGALAASESIRMMCGSALLDAHVAGVRLRSNRLFCAPGARSESVVQAILLLTDERSAFMAGAELQLSTAESGDTNLSGKSILVTGATSGIGRTMAVRMGE